MFCFDRKKVENSWHYQNRRFITAILLFLSILYPAVIGSFPGGPTCLPSCHCSGGPVLWVDCSKAGYREIPFPGHRRAPFHQLLLPNNNISAIDLVFLDNFHSLEVLNLHGNRIKSVSKSSEDYAPFYSLVSLDLSSNRLHFLHSYVFSGFPSLQSLNLSHNLIHTIAQGCFVLPSLHMLDLSYNRLTEAGEHLFETSHQLRQIHLSNNAISRLLDGMLSLLTQIRIIDFSHNAIMKIEDNALVGVNASYLDLGFNSLRSIPTSSLRKLTAATTIVLDGNLFTILQTGSVYRIRVKFLSISHCGLLRRLDQSCLDSLPELETLTVNNNPKLIYLHPGALSNVPRLLALDLTKNSLFSLEDPRSWVPGLRTVYLRGNQFECHCGLRWLHQLLIHNNKQQLRVEDGDTVTCRERSQGPHQPQPVTNMSLLDPLEPACSPYILPLFPSVETSTMGLNVTWLCKVLGSRDVTLVWSLPTGNFLNENQCYGERACVSGGSLTLTFLHPQDGGKYCCIATNKYGTHNKEVDLHVKSLNIQIFAVSVASTFVTLSWNTSKSLSSDYILQVEQTKETKEDGDSDTSSILSDKPILTNFRKPLLQFEDIDVGLKMNSYTVSGLNPGNTYRFLLCLRKKSFILPISRTTITTKPINYINQLGIQKDYKTMAAVGLVLSTLVIVCTGATGFKIYKFRLRDLDGDNISTKEIIASTSEQSSVACVSYGDGGEASNTDHSCLVDHEVGSPVDQIRETFT